MAVARCGVDGLDTTYICFFALLPLLTSGLGRPEWAEGPGVAWAHSPSSYMYGPYGSENAAGNRAAYAAALAGAAGTLPASSQAQAWHQYGPSDESPSIAWPQQASSANAAFLAAPNSQGGGMGPNAAFVATESGLAPYFQPQAPMRRSVAAMNLAAGHPRGGPSPRSLQPDPEPWVPSQGDRRPTMSLLQSGQPQSQQTQTQTQTQGIPATGRRPLWESILACGLCAIGGAMIAYCCFVTGHTLPGRETAGRGVPKDCLARTFDLMRTHVVETVALIMVFFLAIVLMKSGLMEHALYTLFCNILIVIIVFVLVSCFLRTPLMDIRRRINAIDDRVEEIESKYGHKLDPEQAPGQATSTSKGWFGAGVARGTAQATFDGRWTGRNDHQARADIAGDNLRWASGASAKLTSLGKDSFSIVVGGKTTMAQLVGSTLEWDDGDVWVRQQVPTGEGGSSSKNRCPQQ
mmetsp:Transcript_63172/g.137361  ORF Transcript_63172/g.137361 Transcript_63172/m.137361 type:complete len:463 (-) Transcript_63172:114-1502(-)